MIELPDVTLVAVSHVNIERHAAALRHCQKAIKFADALFLTGPGVPSEGFRSVHIKNIGSTQEWGNFVMKELWWSIQTPFMLIVQDDGYILHPEKWTNEFLEYDFIGSYVGWHEGPGSNGGFSLRSRALMQEISKLPERHPEDLFCSCIYRPGLEAKGFKFPDYSVQCRFADHYNVKNPPFGFHGWDKMPNIPHNLLA